MSEQQNALRRVQERFGRHALDYIASEGHAKGSDLEKLLELAKPQKNWLVLDVATGGGHTALKIGPHVKRIIAGDLSEAMLKAARNHIEGKHSQGIEFVCTNAELLPLTSETLDLVTCRIAAHHFDDACRFIRASWRVLRCGGRLVVQDHVLPDDPATAQYVDSFERLRDPTHNRALTEQQWRAAFNDVGFDVEQSELLVKRHHFSSWAERQGCTQRTIDQLVEAVQNAPAAVTQWLAPHAFGRPEATFINHHIIIAGTKPVPC
jgi:ubiquinone/menaquinone biosynthesis C-methylase UbiE